MVEEKKTVIWSGGLDAMLASDPAPTSEAPQTPSPEEVKPLVALSSQPTNDRSGTRIMGSWLAPAVEQAAAKLNADQQPVTRVLPIEDLYPAVAAAERAMAAPVPQAPKLVEALRAEPGDTTEVVSLPKADGVRRATPAKPSDTLAKLRALATGPERERFFLYGGLAAFLVVMGLVLGVRALTAGSEPGVPVAAAAPRPETPRPTQALPAATTSEASAQVAQQPHMPAPAGLERAAVDALARGDYAQAERMYAQLAAAQPDRADFHEAARILARAHDESGTVRTGN